MLTPLLFANALQLNAFLKQTVRVSESHGLGELPQLLRVDLQEGPDFILEKVDQGDRPEKDADVLVLGVAGFAALDGMWYQELLHLRDELAGLAF